jgi:hypothetical protein
MSYVSETVNAGRIVSHGKITSLTSAFSLTSGQPFSIFVIPKNGTDVLPITAVCKLMLDSAASACPISLYCWNEVMIVELGATAINLTTHDVYWGAGALSA